MTTFCKCLSSLMMVGVMIIGFSIRAAAQDTAYAFSTKCFMMPSIDEHGTVRIPLKSNPPNDCTATTGKQLILTDQAVPMTYTTAYTDRQIAALTKNMGDLSATALNAIKESIAENSVKADEIDALVKSIEEKLYDKVLRRVKADLGLPAAAGPTKKKAVTN